MCQTKATWRGFKGRLSVRGYGGRVHLGRNSGSSLVARRRMGTSIRKSQPREGEQGRELASGPMMHVPDEGDVERFQGSTLIGSMIAASGVGSAAYGAEPTEA